MHAAGPAPGVHFFVQHSSLDADLWGIILFTQKRGAVP